MTRFEREVLRILQLAHRRMDERGYAPIARPIDDRPAS